jgi:hypothetical protein
MSRLIYNYDLDERRTARIPASSQAEADTILNAYFDTDDAEARSQFEAAYVEYHDAEADNAEEEGREGLADLVRAILRDDSGGTYTN